MLSKPVFQTGNIDFNIVYLELKCTNLVSYLIWNAKDIKRL